MTNLEITLIEQARLNLLNLREICAVVATASDVDSLRARMSHNYAVVRTITGFASIRDSGLSDEARYQLKVIDEEVEAVTAQSVYSGLI
ncbi:TPA: hypothetical protein ACWLUJ_005750 [Pseudomonas aeruginosa]|nr:hypothetical protein [Pseudomonas aeruginosa]